MDRTYQNLWRLRPDHCSPAADRDPSAQLRPMNPARGCSTCINANLYSRPIAHIAKSLLPGLFLGATILPIDAIKEFNTRRIQRLSSAWKTERFVNVGIRS